MSNQPTDSQVVKITKRPARLSYPQLFEPKSYQGSKPAYSAVFLLDKKTNAADIEAIKAGIDACKKAKWGNKPVTLKGTCLHEGIEKEDTDGYGEHIMFVSCRNEAKSGTPKPGVVDQKLQPITAESGKLYAGCYVYATIRLWAQDNQYGKRVNASIRNVQFVKDGTPFGEKPVAAEDEFEEVPEESVV